jgi:ADP-heptose:LPS heptosyltransferase
MSGDILAGTRKIAVLRANGLGDFVFALPAIGALRHTYPDAEIVLLGKPWHADFLSGRPSPVDRVSVVPPYPGVRDGEQDGDALDKFFKEMQAERFDVAIQMQGGGRNSNPFVRRLRARLSLGLRAPDAADLDRTVPYVYFQNEILRYAEVVGLIGARVADLAPKVYVTDCDRGEISRLLPTDQQLVLLHPGAGSADRRWPPGKFAAVGDAAVEAGAQVALVGDGDEAELTQQVAEAMHGEPINLAGRTSLGGLAALAGRARVFVGNDSGPLHLAAAAGARTVGIFWCFNALTAALPYRSDHLPHISWRTHCPLCGADRATRNRCRHQVSYVDDVPVEPVIESMLALLHAGP